jgi:D-beta-D-heptose 7-phosphate kinase/D-beta-D-heptose 1-phosphate adenosyltransferase
VNVATSPILSPPDAAAWVERQRHEGRIIVFTNGVFDLVHPGHIQYLRAARAEGDRLIVAVNSDRSVRVNKGPTRPILPEQERAELLASLDCVDAVVIFDDLTPADIVNLIQPDVLVKGADWAADAIVGRDTVEARGGRVVRATILPGHSTSSIVEKIRRLSDSSAR